MAEETRRDLSNSIYKLIGYDRETRKVRIGLLAEKTHPYIKEKMAHMLGHIGFSTQDAKDIVEKTWLDTPEDFKVKLMADMRSLFGRLKAKNIKVAICTADSREGTEMFVQRMHLEPLVDMLVCGDDPGCKPKPDPHNALFICDQLGVDPMNAVMVGDTPADTIMGQAANLGLTIGVESGIGFKKDLTHADIIVKSVNDVVDMVTPHFDAGSGQYIYKEFYTINVTTRGIYKIANRGSFLKPKNNVQQYPPKKPTKRTENFPDTPLGLT